jgi:type VI secretion system protein ImpA
MAHTSVLDIDALLLPIAGENPAGSPQAYAFGIREQMEKLRTEERPEDFDDATRPEPLKRADWTGVVKLAHEALSTQSKDLRIACHLLEGLVKVHAFTGLRDGLVLLRRLIEECWDRINPPEDPEDAEARALPLANMLDDAERGMRFPGTLLTAPLLGAGGSAVGLLEFARLRASMDTADQERLQNVQATTKYEAVSQVVEDLGISIEEIKKIAAALDNRVGAAAPSFAALGTAIEDCRRLASTEAQRLQPLAETTLEAGPEDGANERQGAGKTVATRTEAYAQLTRAADLLQQIEPHSPIPYLVKRAVRLGSLPFPLLIQQMVRDTNLLGELNREFGIEGAPGTS